MEGSSSEQLYKVKLKTGRELGPIDLTRIRALIVKKHILGSEEARIYPVGEWKIISQFSEIAEILLKKADGELQTNAQIKVESASESILNESNPTKTQVLDEKEVLELNEQIASSKIISSDLSQEHTFVGSLDELEKSRSNEISEEDERTKVGQRNEFLPIEDETPKTQSPQEIVLKAGEFLPEEKALTEEVTGKIFLNQKEDVQTAPKKEDALLKLINRYPFTRKILQQLQKNTKQKNVAIAAVILCILFILFSDDEEPSVRQAQEFVPVTASLPSAVQKQDVALGQKYYNEGVKSYFEDNFPGYKRAVSFFQKSLSNDNSNVKTYAFLAASYINLVDYSLKDEKYFSVIEKLIDLAEAKQEKFPEVIIAETEYFMLSNQLDVAEGKINEFLRDHKGLENDLNFYLAAVLFLKGDTQGAAKYLTEISDQKVYSPRVFFLKAVVASKLNQSQEALDFLAKAIKLKPNHAKSRLLLAQLMLQTGNIPKSEEQIEYLLSHPEIMGPPEIAKAQFFRGMGLQIQKKYGEAEKQLRKAIKLQPENEDYLRVYYEVKLRLLDPKGDKKEYDLAKQKADMYRFLAQGNDAMDRGNVKEALLHFLEARQSDLNSPLPLLKTGDLFRKNNDISAALLNYKKAAEMNPNQLEVWAKYSESLIESYDFDEAKKALEKMRTLKDASKYFFRLNGDLYLRQGLLQEAVTFYQKALSQERVDPKVYLSYAKTLLLAQKYKDAKIYLNVALRLNPSNPEVIIAMAKAISESESKDKAIQYLQMQMQKTGGYRPELITQLAEIELDRGNLREAERYIRQATELSPDYPEPYRLKGLVFQKYEGRMKDWEKTALDAFKVYSDRNSGDPSGYLERYKIYLKLKRFDLALGEVARIFAVFPKYPLLYMHKAEVYLAMGNAKEANDAFGLEIRNNPNNPTALLEYGKALLEWNAPDQAQEVLNRAMTIAPNSAEIRHLAGWASYQLNNVQAAVALYLSALKIDEKNPLLVKRTGLAYKVLGDHQSAERYFRRYLELAPDAVDRDEIRSYIQ